MDSWFLAAISGTAGNEKMVAEDPVRRFCLHRLKNVPVQLTCIAIVIVQGVLINHHLVVSEKKSGWWAWSAGDAIVAMAFAAGFLFREWRIPAVVKKHEEETGFHKGLPFASLSWALYTVLLSARIIILFKKDLEFDAEIGNLKVTICLTAIVCVFFTSGHHHSHESLARRAAIMALIKTFVIDLLDTVDVLDVLFKTAREHKSEFPPVMEDIVLTVLVLNLVRPSFVLWSLFMDHFTSKRKSLMIKIVKTLMELLMINIPLLIVRSYIGVRFDDFISVFLVKNILGILFGIVEIYDCIWDMNEERRKENYERNDNTNSENSSHQVEATPTKTYKQELEI